MGTFTAAASGFGIDNSGDSAALLQSLDGASVTTSSATHVQLGGVWDLFGTFTAFDSAGHPSAGTLTELDLAGAFTFTNMNVNVAEAFAQPTLANTQTFLADAFSGDDSINASAAAPNTILGYDGADTLNASSAPQTNTLFGGAGADSIVGGTAFNRVNGNTGDDTIVGHSSVGDWLLGGQGQDSIDASASTGNNIVNGNMGDDTIVGGLGVDSLRGGQGNDVIHAGPNGDWISGDLGTNTIYGGQGMDTIHAGAGHDIVYGWHTGDHVQLGSGAYGATQVGSDVHVTFSNGGEMDLINTQLSSLQSGWIT